MSDTITIRSGSSNFLEFTIKSDSVAVNLSGVDEIVLRMKSGSDNTTTSLSTVPSGGVLSVYDAVAGKVRLVPISTTFPSSDIYQCYFDLITGSSVVSYPDDDEFFIEVIDKLDE